jgi:hypothetical protein
MIIITWILFSNIVDSLRSIREIAIFGNSKDNITIYKYFIVGEEILTSNLLEGLSLVINL